MSKYRDWCFRNEYKTNSSKIQLSVYSETTVRCIRACYRARFVMFFAVHDNQVSNESLYCKFFNFRKEFFDIFRCSVEWLLCRWEHLISGLIQKQSCLWLEQKCVESIFTGEFSMEMFKLIHRKDDFVIIYHGNFVNTIHF